VADVEGRAQEALFPGFRLWLILAIQQVVLDQPGGSAAPRIVRAHAKISLLVGDDGLGVADLKPHRVFHSADPRHDPDKGLLGTELQGDCGLAAIVLSQPMLLHGLRICAADVDEGLAPRLRNQPARLVSAGLQLLGVISWVLGRKRSSGTEIFQLEIEYRKLERRRRAGICGECGQ
jgi:hypothetical protein